MTIDEAIKIITAMKDKTLVYNEQDIKDAERLGIEALKQLKAARPEGYIPSWYLLPGETEE